MLLAVFLQAHPTAPAAIVLDLDATDDPVHGNQEGRFFHGYYGHYCYLPLYIFAGEHLLCARLRSADIDASAGAEVEVARIIAHLRTAWPAVQITLRADSGFCRDALMAWCEANAVDYVFGLAKNRRLLALIGDELAAAKAACTAAAPAARVFAELTYQTLDSWTRARRVVAKAEHLGTGDASKSNPRFVVTLGLYRFSGRVSERNYAAISSSSYAAGLMYPSVECRRFRLYQTSMYRKIARRASSRVCQSFCISSSNSSVEKKLSATALS
jgi:hypothetical protein